MKKEVYAYGEHSGATTLTVVPLYVDGSSTTVNQYTVKQGFKLKIYELDGTAETDTIVRIEVSLDGGTTWIGAKVVRLPAGVHQHVSWRFPFIVNAYGSNGAQVRARFYQSSAGAVRVSFHGEVEELD